MAENCKEIGCTKAAKFTCTCDVSLRLCFSHMFEHSKQEGNHSEFSLSEAKTIKKDSSSDSEKSKDSSKDLTSDEKILEKVAEISQEIFKKHQLLMRLKESQRLGQDLSDEITRLGKVIKNLTSKIERKSNTLRKQAVKSYSKLEFEDKEKDSFNNHLESIKISIVESNEVMNKAIDEILSKDENRFISFENRFDAVENNNRELYNGVADLKKDFEMTRKENDASLTGFKIEINNIIDNIKRDNSQELISIVNKLRNEMDALRNEKNQDINHVKDNLQAQIDVLKANNNQNIVNAVNDVRNEMRVIEQENAKLREKVNQVEKKLQDQDNTNIETRNNFQINYQEFNEKILKIEGDIQHFRQQMNIDIAKPDRLPEEKKDGNPNIVKPDQPAQKLDAVIVPAGGQGLFYEFQNMDLKQRINYIVSKGYKFGGYEKPENHQYIKQLSVNRDTSEGEYIFLCKK